ncbi:hypothetical protein DMUE_1201 [Dictyocoela muelleri]|nr:hypothetical protein DMUE_1201 [Dictyocoela muelleri]
MSILDFHLSCADELNLLLDSFNILFYGYGDKIPILQKIFPKNILIENFKTKNLNKAIENELKRIINDKTHNLNKLNIYDLKSFVENKCVVIIPNFNFKLEINNINTDNNNDININNDDNNKNNTDNSNYINTDNSNNNNTDIYNDNLVDSYNQRIRIVGTLDIIDFSFDNLDIRKYNFIFRDLTTFIPYKFNYKNKNIDQLIKSVSNKSKNIFLFLLREIENKSNSEKEIGQKSLKNKIKVSDFMQALKQKFLISKIKTLKLILSEFIEHKVLDIKNDFLNVKITNNEIKRLLANFKNEFTKMD